MISVKTTTVFGAFALASQVSAHGFVSGVVADGIYYRGYNPSDQYASPVPVTVGWQDPQNLANGPITPSQYATSDIICHLGATPAQAYATVKAGGTVNIQWTVWPDSHHGPVISYLANCNGNCTTVDKTTLKFNKFDAGGLINDSPIPGTWATDQLIAANNSRTVTIPSSIAPGYYVLRNEIIALHSAGSANGAQNYPFCVNLHVTGSGTNALSTGTLGTALYGASDPGILIDIYSAISNYVIPGPALIPA